MHQIITVSFDNTMFQLDEEAYSALRRYLDRARAGLAGNPDVNEIVGDLEGSIAEKCSRVVVAGKTIVNSQEMRRILDEMGPVVEGVEATSGEEDTRTVESLPRKLYRQPDGAKLSGVCAGLAEYFSIDVVFIRIAFIAVSLLAGLGLLLYVVLELLMPPRQPEKRDFKVLKVTLLVSALLALYLWASSSQGGHVEMLGLRGVELVFLPFTLLMFTIPLLTAVAFVVVAVAAVKFIRSGSRAKN